MNTTTRDISLCLETNLSFGQCLDFVRQTLPPLGFRVIAEIPFHREFERHVGLRWPNYTVFIVWSPFLAYQAVLSDRDAGIFMPFHMIVADDGKSTAVVATNYALFGRTVNTLGAQILSRQMTRLLREIFSKLSAKEQLSAAVSGCVPIKEAS